MPLRRAARAPLAAAVAVALVAGIVVLARSRAEGPARCAAGMIALGPRCCGEGQGLDGAGRCTGAPARCAAGLDVTPAGCVAPARVVRLAGGTLRVGPGDWEAQGVVTPHEARVEPFAIDAYEVHEQRWAACVAAGACAAVPLSGEPGRAIAGVTLDEAAAFCAWAGGALPTDDELAFAAAGPGARRYAWGDTGAVCRRAAFGLRDGPCGAGAIGPEIAGSHPDGASPEGVLDLAGNVAEWARPGLAASARAVASARGGAWSDGAASALRSWQRRELPARRRSAEVGLRCVYR
jgi:formylglycine-generating enzyme required for sulfatase activity